MDRPNQPQVQMEAPRKVKRVTVVEEAPPASVEEDQSSIIPQLSVQGGEEPKQLRMQQMQDIL